MCERQVNQSIPINTTLMQANKVNTPMVASAPLVSTSQAPTEGATACAIRLGKASLPIRRGKRTGPNSANGNVPRAIHEMP